MAEYQDKPNIESAPKSDSSLNNFFARLGILGELLAFFWRRKLYWLVPMIIALILIGVLIAAGSAGGAGLFIYTLF